MKYGLLALVVGLHAYHGFAQIKKPEKVFDLLQGTWQYQNRQEFESWSKYTGQYTAEVYSMENGDTVMSQQCLIKKDGNAYFFELRVIIQPNLPTIRFQLVEASSTKFKFENKKESFPTYILYEFYGDSLRVTQGGKLNGKEQSISFNYHKLNK